MASIKIKTKTQEFTVSAKAGTTLSDILKDPHFSFSMPCAGNHLCGKCRVFIDGEVSAPDKREKNILGPEVPENLRLACFTKVLGDCTVTLPESYANVAVEMEDGSLKAGRGEKCAIVFDIGTTTVAGSIYGLEPFRLLRSQGELNRQIPFGGDVMSRIEYCCRNGVETLTEVISEQLENMALALCEKAETPEENIVRFVITGNTAMLHIFAGINPDSMAAAPFRPKSLFGYSEKADNHFKGFHRAEIFFPPCIGAFSGADMVCAIEDSRMTEKNRISFIADIGTNGEMALFSSGKLYCCSAAAGPAFEGAEIEMGMPACDGAVYKFFIEGGEISCKTIGDKEPAGICGTGLISAAALMLKTGIMDATGLIRDSGHPFTYLTGSDGDGTSFFALGKIRITQRDIRQLQLAKGAISAAIGALLQECGLSEKDISDFYLCGGFGSRIDPYEAAYISLIPASFKYIAHSLGNAAAKGAAHVACDGDLGRFEKIANSAAEIPLAENEFFVKHYIDEMNFPSHT